MVFEALFIIIKHTEYIELRPSIGYSMFCVGYAIYKRERSFAGRTCKTLSNLFSPEPAVSCFADTQALHREIYILCSILLHFI